MGVRYAFKTALKVQPLFYPCFYNSFSRKFPTFFRAPKTVAWARSSGILRCRTMAVSQVPVILVKENIELTEIEGKIFDRLLATIRHFGLPYELRVAGGWVRDKLLGKDCYDIDIALDNMLGSEFVEKVREYLLSVGEEAQGIAIIPSNPDQSKHLETARMRIFDVWIDFVNLRSEEYSNNSRIPTKQKFGTAEEDAYRRDLTINSLFYNINTGLVEDFTKRGISDLKFGKIVTPLPPKETFLDDPLRVLRAIRFATSLVRTTTNCSSQPRRLCDCYNGRARFRFTLDEGLKEAASCNDVKNALSAKISRERIGTEINLMIAGNQPVDAMRHIDHLTLFWVIFSLPPKIEPAVLERCDGLCVACLDAAWKLIPLIGISIFDNEQKRLCLYAALFLPFRKTSYKDPKSKKISVVHYIFRNSLKLKVSDAETVVNVHRASEKFLSLIACLTSNEENQLTEDNVGKEFVDIPLSSRLRVSIGFLLREIKDFWRVAVCISTLLYPLNIDQTEDFLNGCFELERRSRLFSSVENAIMKLGVDKVWEVKPLVNGREIMNILGLKSGGPLVSEWQQKLMAWQLAHPSATAEECVDWMKQADSKRVKIDCS